MSMHAERTVGAPPGDDVGLQTACFKLNLAEACPGVYVWNVDQRRAKVRCRCRCRACLGVDGGELRAEAFPGDDVAGVDNVLSSTKQMRVKASKREERTGQRCV